jgi:hypothetical protein
MSMDVEYETMTPEQYLEHIKQQEEAGIIQAQAEGRAPVPDVSLGQALHREIHDYGKRHVPHQTRLAWGVFANQHPGLSNLDAMESFKIKSLIRQYESLLFTALPKGVMTPKIMRKIFQGRALAYLNVSKGKHGFEAQMTRSTMIGVVGSNKPAFNPNFNAQRQRPQSRWDRFRGMF